MSEFMDWVFEEMRAVAAGKVDPLTVPDRISRQFGGSEIGYLPVKPYNRMVLHRQLVRDGVPRHKARAMAKDKA